VTTAKPPARYGAIDGARAAGFAPLSYTTTGDTTPPAGATVMALGGASVGYLDIFQGPL